MQRYLGLTFLMMGLLMTSEAFGQPAGSVGRPQDWQIHLFGGALSGETLIETAFGPGTVTTRADSGIMTGLRLGVDGEYNGWELTLAAVFSDVDIMAPFPVTDLPIEIDSSLYLATINLMHFPAGNSMADGRVRPFITVGTGLGYLRSDFPAGASGSLAEDLNELDSEWLYDVNSGFGIKFLLGETGDSILRVDWRWHLMRDFSSEFERIYRQEISVGIGMRF